MTAGTPGLFPAWWWPATSNAASMSAQRRRAAWCHLCLRQSSKKKNIYPRSREPVLYTAMKLETCTLSVPHHTWPAALSTPAFTGQHKKVRAAAGEEWGARWLKLILTLRAHRDSPSRLERWCPHTRQLKTQSAASKRQQRPRAAAATRTPHIFTPAEKLGESVSRIKLRVCTHKKSLTKHNAWL